MKLVGSKVKGSDPHLHTYIAITIGILEYAIPHSHIEIVCIYLMEVIKVATPKSM